jgi:hypothetical protein
MLSYLFVETPSVEDLIGFATIGGALSIPTIGLMYVPGLFWLRRHRSGCSPRWLFPLSSGLILNLPIFVLTGLQAGRTMALSEALLFCVMFLIMGIVFGIGFVLLCNKR